MTERFPGPTITVGDYATITAAGVVWHKGSMAGMTLSATPREEDDMTERFPGPTAKPDDVPCPDPRVTVGWFRHPDFPGDAVDPVCGFRWNDHGWIDSYDLSKIIQPSGIAHGLTVCPSSSCSGQPAREPEPVNSEEKFSLADARVGDTIETTRVAIDVFVATVTSVEDGYVLTTNGRIDFDDENVAKGDDFNFNERVTHRLIERDPVAEAADALLKASLPPDDYSPRPASPRAIIENLAADGWTLVRSTR